MWMLMLAIDIYNRIQKTWDAMSGMREEVILAKLNKRVKDQAGFEDGQIEEMYNAVPDPHNDSFEDIEDNMDDLPPELQERVRQRLRDSRRQHARDNISAVSSSLQSTLTSLLGVGDGSLNTTLTVLTLDNNKGAHCQAV